MSGQHVLDILDVDAAARQLSNKQNDLLPLSSVDLTKDWDYSLPTLYKPTDISKNNAIRDLAHFKASFQTKYIAYLSKLDYNNVLIAGGSIMALLLGKDWDNDVDIFIYGLDATQATEKVQRIMEQLYEAYSDTIIDHYTRQLQYEGDKTILSPEEKKAIILEQSRVVNIRNRHCITLQFGKLARRRPHQTQEMASPMAKMAAPQRVSEVSSYQKIQIILRTYRTKSEILHGFDMGSCAVGYDGTNVVFTSLGKLSYEYRINVVDPTRRSTTYERRLIKYHHRGFQLVMPNLDISKLKTEYFNYKLPEVAALPYMVFSYTNIKDNKILLGQYIKWGNGDSKKCDDSDYQAEELDEYKIFHLNLGNIIRGTTDYYYYSTQANLDILYNPPYITSGQVIDFYDTLLKSIHHCNTINLKALKKSFAPEVIAEIVIQITQNDDFTYLEAMITEQKKKVLKKLNNMCMDAPALNWITKNPGSQITGSFNPILSDPKDWYAEYYRGKPNIKVMPTDDACKRRMVAR